MKKSLEWQDYYKLPIHLDVIDGDWISDYLWTADHMMAFTLMVGDPDPLDDTPDELKREFVTAVNGNWSPDADNHLIKGKNFTADGIDIYMDNAYIGCVRGWGHLTGTGGLNLKPDDAIEIQDKFVEYVIKNLNDFSRK